MIKIKSIRILLPALVEFSENDKEDIAFLYVDQVTNDILIPDSSLIEDVEIFKEKLQDYLKSKKREIITPQSPIRDIDKLKPEDFMERGNG
jgi:hypothetical protein